MFSRHLTNIWGSLIVIGILFLLPISGLRCYQCSSNTDIHCTEMFDHEHSDIEPQECKVYGANYCVKTIGMYKGEVGTQRFCSPIGWGDVCEFVKRKGDYREYRSCVYTCSGDGCNSAPSSLNVASYVFSISLTLAFVFRYVGWKM